MLKKGTIVNGSSAACHDVNLDLDSDLKVSKFLVFLSSRFPYFSDFEIKPLFMYFFIFLNCSISINCPCLWKTWLLLSKYMYALIALGFLRPI